MHFSHLSLNTSHKELMGLFLNVVFEMEIVSYGEEPFFTLDGMLFQLKDLKSSQSNNSSTIFLSLTSQEELEELFCRINFFVYRELEDRKDAHFEFSKEANSLTIEDFDKRVWEIVIEAS